MIALLLVFAQLGTPVAGTRGMVVTANATASQAGAAMLRAGGNAVDAAVAAAFSLAVGEPYSSGLGGGGFALVRMGETILFLDFREVAPAAATRDMYLVLGKPDTSLSQDGIRAAGVPGAVAGYLGLHERFGKLKRAQVLAPAIELAEKGFLVEPIYQANVRDRLALLRKDPEAARIFLVQGDVPPLGARIVQPDLAKTLRALAKDGVKTFYQGGIAERLAADMQARNGLVTRADLAAYKPRERAPLVGSYLGHAVVSSPPPSAGGQVVLTLLNVLEQLPAETPWHDERALHTYIEASKRAFADRFLIGDPGFVPDVTTALVSKARAAKLYKRIGAKAEPAAHIVPGEDAELPAGVTVPVVKAPPRESDHTTHLCTLDKDGNAVALTTTVNYEFGAGVVAKGTGVLWNDQMDDFALAPGVPNVYGVVGSQANAIVPGKVPLSSMSPTLVFADKDVHSPVRMVLGSPGGPRIPTTVVQAIWYHLGYGADIEQALSLGHVHDQFLPEQTFVEPFTLDPATWQALVARGHKLVLDDPWSNATAISVDPKTSVRTGAADRRGVGMAVAE